MTTNSLRRSRAGNDDDTDSSDEADEADEANTGAMGENEDDDCLRTTLTNSTEATDLADATDLTLSSDLTDLTLSSDLTEVTDWTDWTLLSDLTEVSDWSLSLEERMEMTETSLTDSASDSESDWVRSMTLSALLPVPELETISPAIPELSTTSGGVSIRIVGRFEGGAESSAIEDSRHDQPLNKLGVDGNLSVDRDGFKVMGRLGGGGGDAWLGGHGRCNKTNFRLTFGLESKAMKRQTRPKQGGAKQGALHVTVQSAV